MPKPTCVQCSSNDSLLWRSAENGQICNECHLGNTAKKEIKADVAAIKTENEDKEDTESKNGKVEGETTPAKATGKGTRKSTRSTRYKTKTPAPTPSKAPAPRGRGRRSIFKRQPLKAPSATATVVTSDSLFFKTYHGTIVVVKVLALPAGESAKNNSYSVTIAITSDWLTLFRYWTKSIDAASIPQIQRITTIDTGSYMQVGDIVSMLDVDGGTYYAQIRGFLTDQYCEKSAVVTWLLPTKASPPPEKGFDPATYIIGPEEDLPRKLEYMEFVMHAPSDYYKASNSPYPLTDNEVNNYNGFVWTSLEPQVRA